jgi:hypothetical protein
VTRSKAPANASHALLLAAYGDSGTPVTPSVRTTVDTSPYTELELA